VNPRTLAARGIGIDEVEGAVRRHNVNVPTGTMYGPNRMVNVRATGQLMTADAYKSLVVTYKNGAPVRLDELATVLHSYEDDKAASWYFDPPHAERSLGLSILRQPGTNTVEVASAVRALLPSFQAQLPPTAELHIVSDRSQTIKASFEDIQFTMVL